jgi:hypothetical protein
MGVAWLPSAERIPNSYSEGGTYLDGVPWRWVGHLTEAVPSSLAGARSMAARHATPPHLWAWWEQDWLGQTVRLDRSAFALLHPAGTPETNKMRAVQVEVLGYSADSPAKPDAFWRWIGERVVAPLIDAGYAFNLSRVAPSAGVRYGAWPGRMSRAAWRAFDGICMHGNVPDNSHWDMGEADLALIAAAAAGTGDDDMFEAADRENLTQVETLLRQLVPRPAANVMLSGADIGKPVPDGTPGSGRVADVFRWTLAMELERQGRSTVLADQIAAAVVAALPSNPGGGASPAEVEQAVRNVLLSGAAPG